MRNPFADLGKPRLAEQPEEVEGSFSCQTARCYTSPVSEAKYIRQIKMLTWVCPDGHVNRIEDFDLDE